MVDTPTRRPGRAPRSAASETDPKPADAPVKVLPSDPEPSAPAKPGKPAAAAPVLPAPDTTQAAKE